MKLLHPVLVAAAFITVINYVDSKTVVFYPPPLTSYFIYHTNVAAALASLGHDVWLCVPQFMLKNNVVKDPSVKVLVYAEHLGDIQAKIHKDSNALNRFWANETFDNFKMLKYAGQLFTEVARQILSDKSFLDKVRNLKPDLLVVESIPFNMNMIVLPYMLDIPYALIGTFHDVVLAKVPFSPATTPFPVERVSDRMSFTQRLKSTLIYLASINFDLFYDSSIISQFAPHKPYKSIKELAANSEIFIAELDHILDYPRPTLPNTKLVGGSSALPPKPLTGDLKSFVENSKTGIIVVTFGGSIVEIPPYITSKMISAFKQVDLRVVWRVNITSPDPDQIMTSRWLPQNDLLGHNKTKLFISHCGKNGQYEALYHGVPILCLPVFGDQGYNAQRIHAKQLGLLADMRKVTADAFADMIKEIIYSGKYSENMKKASNLYRELYKDPKKESAYWLDHVMRYGGEYMRSTGQQMPWYQIYVLDIIGFLFGVITLILVVVYFVIKQCYQFCRGGHVQSKPKRD